MAKQTIHDLKLDTMNFNRHTDEGLQMIQKSLTQNGFGRSVCVDRDNNVMSGNGVVESAMALGKEKIKIVETTGDELVVVKRTDLTINSKEGRDLAMADNAVAELNWDEEAINKAKEEFNIDPTDWNVDFDKEYDLDLNDISEEGFVRKIRDDRGEFTITLCMPNKYKEKVLEIVKIQGKQALTSKIIELCQ